MAAPARYDVPVLDHDGSELNARVDIEAAGERVVITLRSGSGAGSDYGRALDKMLGALAAQGGILVDVLVAPTTGPNAQLPEGQRRIPVHSVDGFGATGAADAAFDATRAGQSIRRSIGSIISPAKGGAGPNSRLRITVADVDVDAVVGRFDGLRVGSAITKTLNASDLGSASNQWGLHLPIDFAREAAPQMIGNNIPDHVRHRDVDVVDEAGTTWSCAIKRPPSKPEFYLHGSREITASWAISEGDVLRLEVVGPRTLAIAFEIENPPAIPREIAEQLRPEGAVRTRVARFYERSGRNRDLCLERHGYDCKACGDNMEALYGERGRAYIHVHHVVRVADLTPEYQLDIEADLQPVCPNCHAMIHRREPMLSIADISDLATRRPHRRAPSIGL